ncbi:hypothetical protein PUN28_006445 [Cardiocondyla obscurior]|uniref:Transmembrane protein n=1 Tax=Cardiocondyla obscurior TaxID=286306 RepID=A0AAW2GET1_9HYME
MFLTASPKFFYTKFLRQTQHFENSAILNDRRDKRRPTTTSRPKSPKSQLRFKMYVQSNVLGFCLLAYVNYITDTYHASVNVTNKLAKQRNIKRKPLYSLINCSVWTLRLNKIDSLNFLLKIVLLYAARYVELKLDLRGKGFFSKTGKKEMRKLQVQVDRRA